MIGALRRVAARVVGAEPLAAEGHDRPILGRSRFVLRIDGRRRGVRRAEGRGRRARETLERVEVGETAAVLRVGVAAQDSERARGTRERVARDLAEGPRAVLVRDRRVRALVVAIADGPGVGLAVRVVVGRGRAAEGQARAGAPGRIARGHVVRDVLRAAGRTDRRARTRSPPSGGTSSEVSGSACGSSKPRMKFGDAGSGIRFAGAGSPGSMMPSPFVSTKEHRRLLS